MGLLQATRDSKNSTSWTYDGKVGNRTISAAAFWRKTADLRLSRGVHLGGGSGPTMTMGIDAFNVLNTINYGTYVGTVTATVHATGQRTGGAAASAFSSREVLERDEVQLHRSWRNAGVERVQFHGDGTGFTRAFMFDVVAIGKRRWISLFSLRTVE
jgi:hypothetical protein